MRPIPIAQYLNQFGRVGGAPAGAPGGSESGPPWPDRSVGPDNFEARLEEAFEKGRRQGWESARKEAEIAEARLKIECEEREKAERLAFKSAEYARCAENLSNGLEAIEAKISECVARILKPMVTRVQAERIERALEECLARILSVESSDLIRICGPKDLLGRLAEKISNRPVSVEYVDSDEIDVQISAQRTQIESQLRAFVESIDAALA